MAVKLFGFTIRRTEEEDTRQSFVEPTNEDGAVSVSSAGGAYGTYFDMDGTVRNENELITKYREMSLHPECETAIDDIVNEGIVTGELTSPVEIVLDELDYDDKLKDRIRDEFVDILRLLDFNNYGSDIFKKWYVDGRLCYHNILDGESISKGLQELRYIDPRQIKKIREVKKDKDKNGVETIQSVDEYFLFNEKGFTGDTKTGVKIAKDAITYVTSGITDHQNGMTLSYLHKAIKPLNQLRMVEDAVVIYRLSRAPERRIFYIDVGNLPKGKADQYLRDIMGKYKNKLVYDANSGEIRDDKKHMSMLEDYWLPRREGGRGTEISTLPGGQNLGEMEDVNYFKAKLYRSLNVPTSRLEAENAFSIGRTAEITRDEVRFSKLIGKLRNRFSHLFDDLLRKQLILKNIITPEDWDEMKESIHYDFLQDTHFSELKHAEMMRERLSLLQEVDQYVGKYFSMTYIQKNVLQMTEEEISDMEKEIDEEMKSGKIKPEDEGF
jgi:hypothetical protein